MSPEEAAIVKEIGAALRALNKALDNAWGANLEVKLDYTSHQLINKRLPIRNYFARVSKQAFDVTTIP
jgi:hypothetical protein